ncbi:mitochondrial pyruvate dehydrogenase [Cyathus striatus]|nr:mitochondrial pyruvate dehydrogenase [Cyathus striatus]
MSAGFRISPALWDKIHHFASFPQNCVSLQQMVRFGQNPSPGTLLKASHFLSDELPVRLAHRVKELDELPHNLSAMPSIKKVKNWYAQSFEELITFPVDRKHYSCTNDAWPPEVKDYNKRFTKMLEHIKSRHDPTVTTVAQGVLEWKRSQNARQIGLDIQAWLDRFYMSRIGIRFLIGQHVALNTQQAHEDYVGIICTKANIHDIVQEAIENARFVCEEHYAMFKGPPVQLICPRDLTFAYVPGHLSHICFELLKNSLRAVVERFGVDKEDHFPPIKVIVVEGKEDITIKISDEGGGIPRSAIPLIWTYMYTTMESQGLDQNFQASDFKAPMAGFGYGLPLSRLYARYFGGDLRLISMDGFGTDVYIHLNRLSSSREPLP